MYAWDQQTLKKIVTDYLIKTFFLLEYKGFLLSY